MSPLPDLAGRLLLRPGPARAGVATIHSTRPAGLQRVALGRRADELPALMAALHALCAHAHRLAARLAVRAALGESCVPTADERLRLQAGTARDQVLRLAHDWPRLLQGGDGGPVVAAEPAGPVAARELRDCPLWRPELTAEEQLAALPAWLEHRWLGQDVASWLAAWADHPLAWPAQWAHRRHTPLARLLDAQRAATAALATAVRPWLPLAEPAHTVSALSAALASANLDAAAATVPDTGPWSRQHDSVAAPAHNAWMRMVSRLVDLLQLAGPEGADWLSAGAASPAPGEGLAWVETARGLLVHRVVLDDTPAADGPRVRQFQLLAPTDLNFHPRGVLAEALQALPAHDTAAATRLAVAFDPCVVFEVAAPQGEPHA